MNDVKMLLGMILVVLMALMFLSMENTDVQQDTQRIQICLDHPTYRKCADWDH